MTQKLNKFDVILICQIEALSSFHLPSTSLWELLTTPLISTRTCAHTGFRRSSITLDNREELLGMDYHGFSGKVNEDVQSILDALGASIGLSSRSLCTVIETKPYQPGLYL